MYSKPKVLNDFTYQLYKNMIFNSSLEGWATVWPAMTGGTIKEGYYNKTYGLCQDKMWAQGFYGTFLALDWRKTKDPQTLAYIVKFVKATETMLARTNGIYLRDNTKKAGDLYKTFYQQGKEKEKERKDLEISRDQIIGLTTALYMIYRCMDETTPQDANIKQTIESVKKSISTLFSELEGMFKRHEQLLYYPLFNEQENRELGNHANCWAFKPALELAFNRVLRGAKTGTGYKEDEISLATLVSYIGQLGNPSDFADMPPLEGSLAQALNSVNINNDIGKIIAKANLKKRFSIPYFNWNLVMYFLLISGAESKAWAKVAFAFIDTFILLGFKHANLAAVYCYLASLWDCRGFSFDKNLEILSHDIYLFPDTIVPCELGPNDPHQWGSYWPTPNPSQGWWWDFDSVCQDPADDNDKWCTPPPPTEKTVNNIMEVSMGRDVKIDNGLSLLFRNLLYNFKR